MRAVVDFVTRHPNITGGISFHTWSGVLLRPFEHQSDDEMHAEDLWVYQATGPQGHRAHRLSAHLRLPRVPLSPEVGDRRHVRLDLRAPRHLQLGGRDLVADARSGHHRLQVHRLVPRPSARGRPQDAALERREARRRSRTFRGSRSTIRSSGKVEIGGWNRFHAFSNPPPQCLERELARFPEVARVARADLAEARARARGRAADAAAATTRSRWSCRTRAGCRRT